MGCRLAALASRKAIVWVLFSFLLLTWHHALWKLLINLWIILQFFISSIRKDCDFQFCIICQKPQTKPDLNAKVTFSFLCQKKCEVSTKEKNWVRTKNVMFRQNWKCRAHHFWGSPWEMECRSVESNFLHSIPERCTSLVKKGSSVVNVNLPWHNKGNFIYIWIGTRTWHKHIWQLRSLLICCRLTEHNLERFRDFPTQS